MNEGMSGLRVTHNISLLVHQYSSVEFLRHGLILSSSLQKTPDVCFWSFISSFETPGHGIISKFTSEHIWTVSIVNSPVACLGFPHFSSSLRVNNSNVFLFISFILEKPHGLCGIDENHFSPKLRWTLLGILLPPSATVTGPGNMAFSGMDELVQMWSNQHEAQHIGRESWDIDALSLWELYSVNVSHFAIAILLPWTKLH